MWLTSPVKTTLQVFYLPRGSDEFSEENGVFARRSCAAQTRSTCDLGRLFSRAACASDPGERAVRYALDSVALYAFPTQQ